MYRNSKSRIKMYRAHATSNYSKVGEILKTIHFIIDK